MDNRYKLGACPELADRLGACPECGRADQIVRITYGDLGGSIPAGRRYCRACEWHSAPGDTVIARRDDDGGWSIVTTTSTAAAGMDALNNLRDADPAGTYRVGIVID